MATAAAAAKVTEVVWEWEGKDRNGKVVRGETRAAGENQVMAALRRQGVTPTKINVFFFWMLQLPLAWLLALHLGWQHSGVFWAAFVSETAVGLFTLWLFSRGGWKTVKV